MKEKNGDGRTETGGGEKKGDGRREAGGGEG